MNKPLRDMFAYAITFLLGGLAVCLVATCVGATGWSNVTNGWELVGAILFGWGLFVQLVYLAVTAALTGKVDPSMAAAETDASAPTD
jgi:Na+/H+-dicarboxylate symporter